MTTPNPCPFCGYSNIKVISKRKDGWKEQQQVKVYSHYCSCNRCHARGPVTTVTLPYLSPWSVIDKEVDANKEKAIDLWNQAS